MNNTILIDGIRYHKDRPASCRQCYFWKNRKVDSTLPKKVTSPHIYGLRQR